MNVELTSAAESDIADAAMFYEGEQSGLGARFFLEIDQVMTRLEDNPLQFPSIDRDVRRALLRVFPCVNNAYKLELKGHSTRRTSKTTNGK